jgi:hypothetical protein
MVFSTPFPVEVLDHILEGDGSMGDISPDSDEFGEFGEFGEHLKITFWFFASVT